MNYYCLCGPALEVGSCAVSLCLLALALWQQSLIWRLRSESPRVRFAQGEKAAAASKATGWQSKSAFAAQLEAANVLDDLATVATAKKEATEIVDFDMALAKEKVKTDKTAALEKVEEDRHLDLATSPHTTTRESLKVARRARIATLEKAWCAEIATIETARQAEVATLLAARSSERAVLEAARRADCAAAALEAANQEWKRAEAYTSHEIKNRLLAIAELCVPVSSSGAIDSARICAIVTEAVEMIVKRGTVTQLDNGSYEAQLEDVDLFDLVETRAQRAQRPVVITPTEGDAASIITKLRLDPMLLCIIFDNMLSNAVKYGSETVAPAFRVRVEYIEAADSPKEGDSQICRVAIELHNAAGPRHAEFLALGEDEMNRLAATAGKTHARSVDGLAPMRFADEGFPMALECGSVLGGSLRLALNAQGVVATLELPRTFFAVAMTPQQLELVSRLSYAIVDDSAICCKKLNRVVGKAFTATRAPPLIAGATRETIESFPKAVVAADTDVVFIDQNFGTVCQSLKGTDLVCSIRAMDAAAVPKVKQRLIFIVSANDSKDDRVLYKFAGADDCLSKNAVSATAVEELLRKHAATELDRAAKLVEAPMDDAAAKPTASKKPRSEAPKSKAPKMASKAPKTRTASEDSPEPALSTSDDSADAA
ncbi:hypothetical protein M885DRAFT_622131 [Pelagophyceae sp. CCMP2097]|nr:hypothetical protein M885DRAFT_622131 [Pelagophyceae sp. CCMP2097]